MSGTCELTCFEWSDIGGQKLSEQPCGKPAIAITVDGRRKVCAEHEHFVNQQEIETEPLS